MKLLTVAIISFGVMSSAFAQNHPRLQPWQHNLVTHAMYGRAQPVPVNYNYHINHAIHRHTHKSNSTNDILTGAVVGYIESQVISSITKPREVVYQQPIVTHGPTIYYPQPVNTTYYVQSQSQPAPQPTCSEWKEIMRETGEIVQERTCR